MLLTDAEELPFQDGPGFVVPDPHPGEPSEIASELLARLSEIASEVP